MTVPRKSAQPITSSASTAGTSNSSVLVLCTAGLTRRATRVLRPADAICSCELDSPARVRESESRNWGRPRPNERPISAIRGSVRGHDLRPEL
jgi:hypothetical protein